MRAWVWLCAFVAAMAGCANLWPPAPPMPAHKPTCQSACYRLHEIHCPVADPAGEGMQCVDFCLPRWDLACMERVRSCAQADECVRGSGEVLSKESRG